MFENEGDCQKNYERLKKVADRKCFIFNPNRDWVEQIIRLMTKNKEQYSKYYCPCKQHHPVDTQTDVVCPCPTMVEEIERDGFCHCRLFCAPDYQQEKFNMLETITCPGCASKMSAAQLVQALSILPESKDANLLVGSNTADDAGVYRISKNTATVATVDVLTPVVSDPRTYGMIVAANSVSDVYAMGGDPKLALNIVGFPGSGDTEALGQILLGGEEKAREAGVVMMGGHTFVADEIKYGLAVFGYVHPDKIVTNAGAQPGDVIVLTKPIGVGTLIQAVIEEKDQGFDMQRVIKAMTTLNRNASLAMRQAGAHSATDITGFGLAGHLAELAKASRVGIELHLSEIPVHKGALEVLGKGVEDSGIAMNLGSFSKSVQRSDEDSLIGKLIFGSETSGGLAIVLSPDKLGFFRERYPEPAPVIGRVTKENQGMIIVKQ